MKINIIARNNLSHEENNLLKGILDCVDSNYEEKLSYFATAALEEYCRMILGQKVFTRINYVKEYRLYLIIKEVCGNIIPDDQIISNYFQITPSESKSLTRSIASKYQYELRNAIKDTLIIIENATEEGDKWVFTVNSKTKVEKLNKILINIDGKLNQIKKKK